MGGKPLSVWLDSYVGGGSYFGVFPNPETDEAIRHIGTNAIPVLLKMLNTRDSKWKLALANFSGQRMYLVNRRLSWWSASFAAHEAAQGFVALGPSASNAVPQLIRTYRKNLGIDSQWSCLDALGAIGPATKRAIPDLLGATTNLYTETRRAAVEALGNLRLEPGLVVPVLTTCLQDSDSGVRRASVRALAKFGPDAKPAVPALTKLTGDPLIATNAINARQYASTGPAFVMQANTGIYGFDVLPTRGPDGGYLVSFQVEGDLSGEAVADALLGRSELADSAIRNAKIIDFVIGDGYHGQREDTW